MAAHSPVQELVGRIHPAVLAVGLVAVQAVVVDRTPVALLVVPAAVLVVQ